MRRFMVHLVTNIEFVDGDKVSDEAVQNYEKHLADAIRDAAQNLSLRAISGTEVGEVLVAELRSNRTGREASRA